MKKSVCVCVCVCGERGTFPRTNTMFPEGGTKLGGVGESEDDSIKNNNFATTNIRKFCIGDFFVSETGWRRRS
jgi:hypothetical protein